MKQIIKICVLLMCFYAMKAQALSILRAEDKVVGQRLIYTTFSDYFPFGYGLYENKKEPVLESVFKDAMSDLLQNRDELTVFKYYPTVGDAIFDMKDGKTDVFFGAFYSTEAFNDLDFVFPAILNNPIHLIMLPSKIAGVKQADDLKNLKGVYALNEHFGDYMLKTFSELNMKAVQDEDEAYESLFTGEADYILGSYYYHFAKLVEKGLKNEVAFLQNRFGICRCLWQPPKISKTEKWFMIISDGWLQVRISKKRFWKKLSSL
ncbi:MAG: hypothetical protein IJ870_06800 [Alphaproteobacteria bacterium]|nr:hypothetical protein [Alphaproteobacteria bacterium]